MGRPKSYTPRQLARNVERYFNSISRHAVARDENGEIIYNDDGVEIEILEYIVPPMITGLCRYLGITRRTWTNYADPKLHPEFADICDDVSSRIEEYLEGELLTRPRSVQGIIFNLQNNFGWKNEKKIELSGGIKNENMSLEDKLAEIDRLVSGENDEC